MPGEFMIKEERSREGCKERNRAVEQRVRLLGQPPLWRYLDFVEHSVVDGHNADRAVLVGEWRDANNYYRDLEQREAGIANQAECLDLPPSLVSLVSTVQAHPHFLNSFDSLPTTFGMVELDRLIVSQHSVTQDIIELLKTRLEPEPDLETLCRFCLPLEPPAAPVQIRRVDSDRYVFRCDSTDLRSHGETLLEPKQIQGYDSVGAIAGVLGLVVGFSSNLLSVVRIGKRMLLHNGYHRACAMHALGIKHAPCIIQTVIGMDELEIATTEEIVEAAEFYFESARPPLLKDFFDPKIRKLFQTYKMVRVVEASFEVRTLMIPE